MTMPVANDMTESVFSLKLWQNLFLVKLQAFPINGSDRVCAVVCKASGLQ